MAKDSPILILGGKGKTGSRVDTILKSQGYETRPVSRSTTPSFDWNAPQDWGGVFEGVRVVYVTYQPDLAVPGAVESIHKLCQLALQKGVQRLVLLSGRGEKGAQQAEDVLKASGLSWTIVRSSWFCQNFSEHDFKYAVMAGELALPVGEVPEPFIDADDIAEVVVAALTQEGHENRLYEVTGPRAITFAQAMAEISKEIGRPVQFTQISPQSFAQSMVEAQVPQDIIDLMLELFTEVLDGRNTNVMNGVEEALGRPPRDFSEYARTTAATGVWNG